MAIVIGCFAIACAYCFGAAKDQAAAFLEVQGSAIAIDPVPSKIFVQTAPRAPELSFSRIPNSLHLFISDFFGGIVLWILVSKKLTE